MAIDAGCAPLEHAGRADLRVAVVSFDEVAPDRWKEDRRAWRVVTGCASEQTADRERDGD